ncbi:UDP-N-acetylmuramoyl-tripeptide--D-alanyl-D-alanine ligase [Salinicoccus carnicancri]|uniref:UDP-N-acetylmuramoyl-tripeptide--D-alanyl-D- alanine ligase n=1 Tax=Salinicoccus carnicancri TaxID=558170 RepID=UPI0002DD76F8|nr:UDP-N-acetylmuramoyl-tripeptide--D-alanyl-D-alanine ligase [Salinicoccus carnicancri]
MIEVTIGEIAEFCNGKPNKAAEAIKNEKVKGVSIDTRTIEKGNLFIPFLGENADGHRFIDDAFGKGASLSLTEHEIDEGDPRPLIRVEDGLDALQTIAREHLHTVEPKVIAITGSNGKTTTKDMLECLLAPHYRVQKTIGNYNNEIGLPLTILQLDVNTEISILEMGMDAPGDIDFLSKMTVPDVAIITNVGESHIEKLGSRENIAAAKYEIVNGLKHSGTFIYSRDYPLLEQTVDRKADYTIRTGGIDMANDVQISHVEQTSDGTSFNVSCIDEAIEIPQLGAHNASNATLALLAAEVLGLDMAEVKGHFKSLQVTDMRMQRVKHSTGALIINDAYNASPSSMKGAIDTVGSMRNGFKILVLADILELGTYSRELHESIGGHIDESPHEFDLVLTYGDGARIIHDTVAGTKKAHFDSLEALAGALAGHLGPDTVILLKGSRGMAVERVIDHL